MQKDELIRVTIKALESSRTLVKSQLDELDNAISFQKSQLGQPVNKNIEQKVSPLPSAPPAISIGNRATREKILAIFDEKQTPLKLQELQEEYQARTASDFNIREFVRGMQKRKELRIMKINNSNRNSYWIRAEWVNDNKLKEEFNGGFDMLYSENEITFV